MSVTRPALSRASVLPGTSRSTRSATARSRTALAARVDSSCAYSVTSRPSSANSATAPFSATIASSGHVAAKSWLQPIGRPVTAITGTPADRRSCSAASASGSIAAVAGQRVVDVGQQPAYVAGRIARQAAQRGGSRRAHCVKSCTRPRWTQALVAGYNSVQFRGALQGRTRSQARNSSLQPRSPARSPWVRVLNLIGVLWRVLV